VKAGSELGKKVASILEAGDLVSDDIVNQLVEERFKSRRAAGVLLDGFPRTIGQAEALEAMLGDDGIKLCINLECDRTRHPAALVARVCQECGTTIATVTSKRSRHVLELRGDVIQRTDDYPEAIRTRLMNYERDTEPLLSFYGSRAS